MRRTKAAWLLPLMVIATLHAGGDDVRLVDAVKSGNLEAVRGLIARKADVNATEADGTTALHWAVRSNALDAVQVLLRAKANPNAANRYGVTPLSLAALNGNAEMLAALIAAGANPKAPLTGGQTLLMAAARTGNADAVNLLLQQGLDVNAAEESMGETALIWAAAENHGPVVTALIKAGADPNHRSKALEFEQTTFGLEGVTTILPRGSWTPLMYAARQGSLDATRALAAGGADLNAADPDGSTAMLIAILNGHFDVAAHLTEKGADPNITDSTGTAALYAAVDMNVPTEVYGRPTRKNSGEVSSLELIKVLLKHGANPNAQLLKPTLQKNHTPGDGTLNTGATPMMRAAKNGDYEAIRLLLDAGGDPALAQANGTTALMVAAGLGRGTGVFAKDEGTEEDLLECVRLLVGKGVDVNLANNTGQTAMHYAVLAGDSLVQELAAHGAQLEVKDKQGRTPMDVAMGVGVRGRAGTPPVIRDSTIALLKKLIAERAAPQQAAR